MGKRKQQLITGMTKEQRIKAAIKRREEQRKEEAKQAAKVAKAALVAEFWDRDQPTVGIPPGMGSPPEIERDQVKLDTLRKKFNVG